MKRKQLETLIKEKARKSDKLEQVSSGYIANPYLTSFAPLSQQQFNISYYAVYRMIGESQRHYVTVLGFYNDHYVLKCGDPYIEGRMTEQTMQKLLRNAVESVPTDDAATLEKLLKEGFGKTPRSVACNANQNNHLCDHLAHFLYGLPNDTLDSLHKRFHLQLHGGSAAGGLDPKLSQLFNRYAFRKHLLIEGDKGSGKTHHAVGWGESKKFRQLFVGGHEQFESIDFLGHFIQHSNGTLLWKDGALTEAFRAAAGGTRTILVIDEMLRIPKRELNILVSALSPINGEYVLRTGRALDAREGIAVEEVIRVPQQNLWVIGTTNIGADYAVEEIDEALLDRFRPVRKDTTEHELRRVLIHSAESKGYSLENVEKLMHFYTKMLHLVKARILSKRVNLRHLNEALLLARNQEQIRLMIEDSILLWVERDAFGSPVEEQITAITMLIKKIWGSA